MTFVVNHLEQIPIYRLTKKQPLKRCGPQRFDKFAASLSDATPQCREVIQRVEERDVSAELCLEGRGDESFDEEYVQFLTVAEVEPADLYRRICGY